MPIFASIDLTAIVPSPKKSGAGSIWVRSKPLTAFSKAIGFVLS